MRQGCAQLITVINSVDSKGQFLLDNLDAPLAFVLEQGGGA